MDGEGFPGRSLCCGDIWKRHGSVVGDCDEGWDEGDFQGWGRYAPSVMSSWSEFESGVSGIPWSRRRDGDCQVMTL